MDFKKLFQNRHEYAREWKARTGGKIVGYFEPYFPEEIAYAAGLLPVRVMAVTEPDDVSENWMFGACYPARAVVNELLHGRYDYVDAFINTEGCQWMFNAFEIVEMNMPQYKNHYLFLPDYVNGYESKNVLRSELEILKGKYEEWFDVEITDEKLDYAIEVYNKNRLLLQQIYTMRRDYRSPLLGSEAMNVLLADQVMDKAEMNVLLEKFIEELEAREPYEDRIRLMLVGSETWNTELEELVESCGANIVVDELDNGTSYFWNNIVPGKDRLERIGMRYLDRPHCALKDNNFRRRPQHIFELAEDSRVDGVLFEKQIYCHPHGSDAYAVWKVLREHFIPYHYFERDMSVPDSETRQRIMAFINMLRPGLVRLRGWHTPNELQEV